MKPRYLGRKNPYTKQGIRRVPCARCGLPSQHQWTVCSNGNRFMGVCLKCDIALNDMALKFFKFDPEHRKSLMDHYKRSKNEVTGKR